MSLRRDENPSVIYLNTLNNSIIQMDKSKITLNWVIMIPCLIGNLNVDFAALFRPIWAGYIANDATDALNINRFKDALREAYDNQQSMKNKSSSSSNSSSYTKRSSNSDDGKMEWRHKRSNNSSTGRDDSRSKTITYTQSERENLAKIDCHYKANCKSSSCPYKHNKDKHPAKFPDGNK